MPLKWELYLQQKARWPQTGRHVLAQYDAEGIVVYQAYSREIASWALEHGSFGGPWSLHRYSWIKTNFLWMMYRSGWGTKENQVATLAIKLRWEGFLELLHTAVHTHHVPEVYGTQEQWQAALRASTIRLQWDPDHSPAGGALERRALQLGVAGPLLHRYAREWLLGIEDVSDVVAEQRIHVERKAFDTLMTPVEHVWPVPDAALASRLGVSPV